MVCVYRRVSPTVASVVKATKVNSVTDDRSLQPAGGSAAGDTASVVCQRRESLSAIVNQGTLDHPVTQV